MNSKMLCSALALVAVTATAAHAGDSGWYVQAGVASVAFNESTSLTAAGGAVPSSNVDVSSELALGVGIGYFFNPNVSVIGIIGTPPTSSITGEGTIAGLDVGEVTYGPAILAANYHFNPQGRLQPFVGAGISYTMVFDESDGSVNDLSIDNAFGGVLRAGFDYLIDDKQGVFFSANKLITKTTITGTVSPAVPGFGGAPVVAEVDLNPWILHAGYTYRF
ncbi:hypothetical protein NBRC116601_17670 [Cognatishimia sp. WU-CL00825]|uniref:OmpW/AlkL family protein n=1 Tax=Cognatishimia sp. WU-CL00825 TaxID=3127658 RepID=UPI003104F096